MHIYNVKNVHHSIVNILNHKQNSMIQIVCQEHQFINSVRLRSDNLHFKTILPEILNTGPFRDRDGCWTHRYFDTSSDQFDGALKVMAMKDEAIILTAAVIRLSPPGMNAANWHT